MAAPRLKSVPKSVRLGIAVALPVELLALLIGFASSGAGHGDYVLTRLLFPWSMLLTLIEGEIGPMGVIVGLVQFLVYGGLLGWSIARRTYSRAALVGGAHLIGAATCFTGVLSGFS
jgi:hypothetical protein